MMINTPSMSKKSRHAQPAALAPSTPVGARAENPTALERHRCIAAAAFYRAERRGFCPGGQLEDWLTAEREFNQAYGLAEPEPRWDR